MVRTLARLAAGILVLMPFAAAGGSQPGFELRPLLTLQVAVSNLDRSIAFYERTLGFTVRERRDDLKFAHLRTHIAGLELGLGEVAEAPIKPSGMVLNFSVKDVAEARRTLESRGISFTGPTHVIPGKVALAEFRDPDGHRVRLAGPPPPAGDEVR
jgi:catechol 2,3-dioxygenase-like lactoylglutathione lyase family enzyme